MQSGGIDTNSLLSDACAFVRAQSERLQAAIREVRVEDALRHSLRLVNELRTSLLGPVQYYKLYFLVAWELQRLATFLADTKKHGMSPILMYQLVQHEGSLIPRLYLLVTVGSVLVRLHEEDRDQVLADLVQMLQAVQHPMRGMFLRHFFLQICKDKMVRSQANGNDGNEGSADIQEAHSRVALGLLLDNFQESAKLWLRWIKEGGGSSSSSSSSSSPSKVAGVPLTDMSALAESGDAHVALLNSGDTQEGQMLGLLVAAQLVQISRLPGFTFRLHEKVVMPAFVQLMTSCKDPASRSQLLPVFIGSFPNDFHLQSLDTLLEACMLVGSAIDIRPVLQDLLHRLTAFAAAQPAEQRKANVWDLFHKHFQRLRVSESAGSGMSILSLLELQLELLVSTMLLHPGDSYRADLVLKGCVDLLQQSQAEVHILDDACAQAVLNLMAAPLTQEALVPKVLGLPHHARLMMWLSHQARQDVATAMVAAILAGGVRIRDATTLEHLFALIDPLIRDEAHRKHAGIGANTSGMEALRRGGEADAESRQRQHDPHIFQQQQEKIAQLVHNIEHEQPEIAFKMLLALRGYFEQGGPFRCTMTLPALIVAILRLAQPIASKPPSLAKKGGKEEQRTAEGKEEQRTAEAVSVSDLLRSAHELCLVLVRLKPAEALQLWLLSVCVADKAAKTIPDVATACVDYMQQALWCLENEIKGEVAQFRCFELAAGSLMHVSCIGDEPYGWLVDRMLAICTNFSALAQQAKALCACTRLHWHAGHRNAESSMTCLRGALQRADAAIHVSSEDVVLFAELLDTTLSLAEEDHPDVSSIFVQNVVMICIKHIGYAGGDKMHLSRRAFAGPAERLRRWADVAASAEPGGVQGDAPTENAEEESSREVPKEDGAAIAAPKDCTRLPPALLQSFLALLGRGSVASGGA